MMDYWRDKSTMCSSDVGDPTIGLSDAIVGTYGPVLPPHLEDDGGGAGIDDRGIDRREHPSPCCCCCCSNPPAYYCCGAGTGFLIDESEIVL